MRIITVLLLSLGIAVKAMAGYAGVSPCAGATETAFAEAMPSLVAVDAAESGAATACDCCGDDGVVPVDCTGCTSCTGCAAPVHALLVPGHAPPAHAAHATAPGFTPPPWCSPPTGALWRPPTCA